MQQPVHGPTLTDNWLPMATHTVSASRPAFLATVVHCVMLGQLASEAL